LRSIVIDIAIDIILCCQRRHHSGPVADSASRHGAAINDRSGKAKGPFGPF
jgi:hypothetical protein